VKTGTFSELGKLALNGALAVFVATIIQPIVIDSVKIDYGVVLGGIIGVLVLVSIGVSFLEKGP